MASLEVFLRRKLVVLRQDVPVYEAARAMCEKEIGCVLLCDEHSHLKGIVTDRDLMCLLLTTPIVQADIPVAEVMSTEPVTIDSDGTLEDAIQLMQEAGVRRLPIVQRSTKNEKRCVGLVTMDDLIAQRRIDNENLAKIISSQIKQINPHEPTRTAKAEARSEAHVDQTLNHFHKVIAEKTRLDPGLSVQLTQHILQALVSRLHYRGAAHIIAQLPKGLQEDLLDLPAGPNRDITSEVIIQGVASHFQGDSVLAKQVLTLFFDGLAALLDQKALAYLWAQLPQEIRELFGNSVAGKGFQGKFNAA